MPLKNSGAKTNANIQAIYTLSICASSDTMKRIEILHSNELYLNACLYAHAKTRTSIDWILERFSSDIESSKRWNSNKLQVSAHAAAVALKNDEDCPVDAETRGKVVRKLIDGIMQGKILRDVLVVCILAIGTICDSRIIPAPFSEELIRDAVSCINAVPDIYPDDAVNRTENNRSIALKLIRGEQLNEDEEKYLLTKLEM